VVGGDSNRNVRRGLSHTAGEKKCVWRVRQIVAKRGRRKRRVGGELKGRKAKTKNTESQKDAKSESDSGRS